jgi:hypothetical protein
MQSHSYSVVNCHGGWLWPFDDPCFTAAIEMYTLPERFTFPFYYQPHLLCILAVQQLQVDLVSQNQWQHNFGLLDDPHSIIGEMFGVLLVENVQGELGFDNEYPCSPPYGQPEVVQPVYLE